MFRYRAWNINGAGDFSDIAHLLAAKAPSQPPQPTYGSSTTDSITVNILPSPDDQGAQVSRLELYISDHLQDTWSQVTSYDGTSLVHTLT